MERGVAGVAFYGGEEFSGDTGNLIEVAVLGGFVERGLALVVFYGGEQCSGDTAKVLQGAFFGGLVQSGGAVFVVDDAGGEVWRGWWVVVHRSGATGLRCLVPVYTRLRQAETGVLRLLSGCT